MGEGVIPEEERERHLPPPLWEANQQAWELYGILHDQYRVLGFDAQKKEVKALDLVAVSAVLEIYKVEDKPATLQKIWLIFHQMNR